MLLGTDQTMLLQRLKKDDASALKDIFQAFYPMVYRTIYRIVADQPLAEDLAQDVFMRFWEKRQKIEVQGVLEAYIRRMAVNEALGYIRKNKKISFEEITESHTEPTNNSEDLFLDNELENQMHQAIESLPPKCKTVFVLSRFEELSHKEISEQLNISTKTVENQITKALKTLKNALKNYLAMLLFLF